MSNMSEYVPVISPTSEPKNRHLCWSRIHSSFYKNLHYEIFEHKDIYNQAHVFRLVVFKSEFAHPKSSEEINPLESFHLRQKRRI